MNFAKSSLSFPKNEHWAYVWWGKGVKWHDLTVFCMIVKLIQPFDRNDIATRIFEFSEILLEFWPILLEFS